MATAPPARRIGSDLVAVTAPTTFGPSTRRAATSVAPVVRTSSTSTVPDGGCPTGRNRGTRRSPRRCPAFGRCHHSGRRRSATGRPVIRPTAPASVRPGSTPKRTRRGNDRGMGTRVRASCGSRATIAAASRCPAAGTPSYLRRRTRIRPAPMWARAGRTTKPTWASGAGRRVTAHAPHRAVRLHARQARQTMPRLYSPGGTRTRLCRLGHPIGEHAHDIVVGVEQCPGPCCLPPLHDLSRPLLGPLVATTEVRQ